MTWTDLKLRFSRTLDHHGWAVYIGDFEYGRWIGVVYKDPHWSTWSAWDRWHRWDLSGYRTRKEAAQALLERYEEHEKKTPHLTVIKDSD